MINKDMVKRIGKYFFMDGLYLNMLKIGCFSDSCFNELSILI